MFTPNLRHHSHYIMFNGFLCLILLLELVVGTCCSLRLRKSFSHFPINSHHIWMAVDHVISFAIAYLAVMLVLALLQLQNDNQVNYIHINHIPIKCFQQTNWHSNSASLPKLIDLLMFIFTFNDVVFAPFIAVRIAYA